MAEKEPTEQTQPPSPEERTQVSANVGGESRPNPPYLVIVEGPHRGARYPLQTGANLIGRLEECNVVLDDQSVSRRHSRLTQREDGWVVEDLGSKNGTAVNGAQIQEPVVLGHRDILRVGLYLLRLVIEPMTPEEEMEIPPELAEPGTVQVTAEGEGTGDTARVSPQSSQDTHRGVITAPESPLDAAGPGYRAILNRGIKMVRRRMMLVTSLLFGLILLIGLYFYWVNILGNKSEEPKTAAGSEGLKRGEPSEPVSIPLGPPEPPAPKTLPVFLDCVANPLPATVFFEGKELGSTPLKVNVEVVPQQSYPIEARFEFPELQEKFTDKREFKIAADQSLVTLLFRAPVGTIKLADLPRDVSIYLEATFDYDPYRSKPMKLQNIVLNKPIFAPFGRYVLELRRFKEVGGESNMVEDIIYRREFVLKEDKPIYSVEVTDDSLTKFPAEIRSKPLGADVFVDQQKVGVTPFVGDLPLGQHTLTLHKEGYFESSQNFSVDISLPFKTEIELRTSPAGEKLNQAKEFINQGANDGAIQSLSEVFTLNPSPMETAEARYLLGTIYLQAADYTKALGYFEQASEHELYKYRAKLGVVRIYAAQKQIPQALLPLVEVLLNSKEEDVLREAKAVLKEVSPFRSVVYIQSDPPGATVFLNDKKMEQVTPLLLHELGLGSYPVRIEKPGFEPVHLTLQLGVAEFNPVVAKLKPLPQ